MQRYFTLETSKQALTLVAPIVGDIVKKMTEAQRLHDAVVIEKNKPITNEQELFQKLAQAEKLVGQVEYHIKELQGVGAFIKDLSLGLVDFPCIHEGRVVYLCWMLGETEVNYWHELYQGFAQRKRVDESFKRVTV